MLEKKNDLLNNHYVNGAMQPIQVMQALMTREQFIGFLFGNEIKYRMRMNYKGQKDSDFKKALIYNYWRFLVLKDEKYLITPERDVLPEDWTYRVF